MSTRIPEDSSVRRRLFEPENLTEEAKVDNLANILQESINAECVEKSRIWNFDFLNDVPLAGIYEWHPSQESYDWIGVKRSSVEDVFEKDSLLPMKEQNEITPKQNETNVSQERKRRQLSVSESEIRKRISFNL